MWSSKTLKSFEILPDEAPERVKEWYYGPWDNVLRELFPDSEDRYYIYPQWPAPDGTASNISFVVESEAEAEPVLFLEIKPSRWTTLNGRAVADREMRERFLMLTEYTEGRCHVVGISAIGNTFAAYIGWHEKTDDDRIRSRVEPRLEASSSHYVEDVAPEDWWSNHVLEKDGYELLMKITEEASFV